jgi:outer membrane biosynthesis protein TonB
MAPAPLSRHIAYSVAIHFALLLALIVASESKPKKKFYGVQFLGGASGFGTGKLEPAPAPSRAPATAPAPAPAAAKVKEKPKPSADKNKVAVSKEKDAKTPPAKAKAASETQAKAPPVSKGGAPDGRGEAAKGKGDSLAAKYGPVGGVGTSLEIGGFGPGGPPAANSRFPYAYYVNALYQKLWRNWDYRQASNKECVMMFVIRRDGRITDIEVAETSNDSLFDDIAYRAVANSSPLGSLPESYPEPELPVYVRFRLE